MNTLIFFRKGIFALLVAATALVACSKDSDDNGGNNNLPEPKPNTVTLKGAEKKITSAEYIHKGGGNCELSLYLNNSDEEVLLELNKTNHMNGTPIELSKNDTPTQGWAWGITYYDSAGNVIIRADGDPGEHHFTQGTLSISAPPESGKDITILLRNGKVMGKDGKTEYTLTLNYSGKMTNVTPKPEPNEIEKIKENMLGKWKHVGNTDNNGKYYKPIGEHYVTFKSDGKCVYEGAGMAEKELSWNIEKREEVLYMHIGNKKFKLKLEENMFRLHYIKEVKKSEIYERQP